MEGKVLSAICLDYMKDEDLPSVASIERVCFTTPWSDISLFNELRRPRSVARVARSGDSVAGYIFGCYVMDEGHILDLAVDPGFRRRGIASALVHDMVGRLKEEGCRFIFLEVRASNAAAVKLYESISFEVTGRRKDYYTLPVEDAVMMALKLA